MLVEKIKSAAEYGAPLHPMVFLSEGLAENQYFATTADGQPNL
jgi:hypothetical protein